MKIVYKKGDLLDAPETHILHGCNCRGVMGSGVAKGIREKFPEAYSAYREKYVKEGLHVGDVQYVASNDKVIINCITQHFYGKDGKLYLDYEALVEVFTNVNKVIPEGSHIAMPKIGAGLAGGNWDIIEKIIGERSTRFQPVVYEL